MDTMAPRLAIQFPSVAAELGLQFAIGYAVTLLLK